MSGGNWWRWGIAWFMAAPISRSRCASTDAVLDKLDALCPLAPLHQPHNLAAIRAVKAARPRLVQVACFDTGFHQTQPPVATRLALPRADRGRRAPLWLPRHLLRIYRAPPAQIDPVMAGGRVIAAHLGNGASLCAMKGGGSIDTTMGFTALDGLVMGTRCG
jgi:acetate kinase